MVRSQIIMWFLNSLEVSLINDWVIRFWSSNSISSISSPFSSWIRFARDWFGLLTLLTCHILARITKIYKQSKPSIVYIQISLCPIHWNGSEKITYRDPVIFPVCIKSKTRLVRVENSHILNISVPIWCLKAKAYICCNLKGRTDAYGRLICRWCIDWGLVLMVMSC